MKKDLREKNQMIISCHQPHYLPPYQYFDKIKRSSVFVFLDDVQYSKNNWINRNRIKNNQGNIQWLTVPVKNSLGDKISEVEIVNNNWIKKHINTIEQTFKCKNKIEWKGIKRIVERNHRLLYKLNCELVRFISKNILGFDTSFIRSSEFKIETKNPDDRIIQLVNRLNGTKYIAGQGGKNYMDLKKYKKHFRVEFQTYKEEEPLSILHKVLK